MTKSRRPAADGPDTATGEVSTAFVDVWRIAAFALSHVLNLFPDDLLTGVWSGTDKS
jgi:hypothetical protein